MKYRFARYLLLFTVLMILHIGAPAAWIIPAWALLGFALPVWFMDDRYFMLYLPLLELLAGILLYLLGETMGGPLRYLAHNSGISVFWLAGGAIVLNGITCFLCIATPFTFMRLFIFPKIASHER